MKAPVGVLTRHGTGEEERAEGCGSRCGVRIQGARCTLLGSLGPSLQVNSYARSEDAYEDEQCALETGGRFHTGHTGGRF